MTFFSASRRGRPFGLFRHWESPEDGDEPFGTLTDRDTALLAAAFLPLVDRARSFSVDPEDAAPGVKTILGGCVLVRTRCQAGGGNRRGGIDVPRSGSRPCGRANRTPKPRSGGPVGSRSREELHRLPRLKAVVFGATFLDRG